MVSGYKVLASLAICLCDVEDVCLRWSLGLESSAFAISESQFRYADGGASDNQAVALPCVLAVGANKLGVDHGSCMFVGSDIRVIGLYLVEHIRLTSASTSVSGCVDVSSFSSSGFIIGIS